MPETHDYLRDRLTAAAVDAARCIYLGGTIMGHKKIWVRISKEEIRKHMREGGDLDPPYADLIQQDLWIN